MNQKGIRKEIDKITCIKTYFKEVPFKPSNTAFERERERERERF